MITYLINSVLCSSILYLAYIFLLENENFHHFKRGFLLFSLIFSLVIPLIPLNIITLQILEIPKQTTVIFAELNEIQYTVNESIEQMATALSSNLPKNDTKINFWVIPGTVYLLVTAVLLFRFLLNIVSITRRKRQRIVLANQDVDIVLIKEKITPHSFGKYIFINREDYENKRITEEIIIHESSHIRQRHFLDIIFMELLIIFFWFNPMLYLYRNKIKLNHEFLADNAVIRENKNVSYYQTLLIGMACRQKSSIITSSFNFSLIKKRFIMMTKTTSKKKAYCRTLALIPILFAAIGLFTTKGLAQNSEISPNDSTHFELFQLEIELNQPSIYPVDIEKVKHVSGYGMRINPKTNKKSFHHGIDFAISEGEKVIATADGIVVDAKYEKQKGNYVTIQHNEIFSTLYSHLKSISVQVGDKLEKGQPIGYVGNTGYSTGFHLHYEVLKNGQNVNPIDYLPK